MAQREKIADQTHLSAATEAAGNKLIKPSVEEDKKWSYKVKVESES